MFFKSAVKTAKIEPKPVQPVEELKVVDVPEPVYETFQDAPVENLVQEAKKELTVPTTMQKEEIVEKIAEQMDEEDEEDDLDAQIAQLQAKKEAEVKRRAEEAAQRALEEQKRVSQAQPTQQVENIENAVAAVLQDHENRLSRIEAALFRIGMR
jgi:RNase adaptor protein for sRNA GlmZ degradation